MAVDNQPGDLVILIRDDGFVEEGGERQIGERELRRHPLFAAVGDQAGERVAAARRRRLGQQGFQIGKDVTARADGRSIHRGPRSLSGRRESGPTIAE